MAFRGYFTLNGVEIVNSSRAVAHMGGSDVPTSDMGLMSAGGDCSTAPVVDHPLLGTAAPTAAPIDTGRLLYTPADGTRMYSQGLALVGDCWTPDTLCLGCRGQVGYDDSWPDLADFVDGGLYRPELAPWYTTQAPESAEFGGIWAMDVKGLDATAVQRDITEMAGSGGVPGPHRDPARKVTFDAILIACTNAGLTFGLQWLACALRDTIDNTDGVLRYFTAHPGHSAADPDTLVREVYGVVLTQAPTIQSVMNTGRTANQQATLARVQWELAVTRPYSYLPAVPVAVDWDTTEVEAVQWVHAAECEKPPICDGMPALFAEGCEVQRVEVVNTPPPACGGCLPVCSVTVQSFVVPTTEYLVRCRETAVSLSITNDSDESPLSVLIYWRRCNFWEACDDQRWPVQVTGLPAGAELVLDGISESYWVNYLDRRRRPFGIVGTPSGAPWRPPIVDRAVCWELVATSATGSEFTVSMSLADREA